jgi:maltose/moltooligosaccharide transporter
MLVVGGLWTSILSILYAMRLGLLQLDKTGIVGGVFKLLIVIPQIVAATILGFLA